MSGVRSDTEIGMAQERNTQHEKFVKVARELETDESEEAFDEKLKKIAKAPPEPKLGKKKAAQ